MGRIALDIKLKRDEPYWEFVQTCYHGDWCLDCHWNCTAELKNEDGRPVYIDDDLKTIKIHEDIYLSLFPDGLDENTLLLSSCGKLTCINPGHQTRRYRCEFNPPKEKPPPKPRKEKSTTTMTPTTVREIRRLRSSGESITNIAKRFSTTKGNVGMIVHRRTWAHVKD